MPDPSPVTSDAPASTLLQRVTSALADVYFCADVDDAAALIDQLEDRGVRLVAS